jgi:hypothetical protein
MKYYIGRIGERNGDFEYDTHYLFSTKGSADKHAMKVAKDWRGSTSGDWDKDAGGYWADCSLVYVLDYQEIPKEDFDVMKKYLAVL